MKTLMMVAVTGLILSLLQTCQVESAEAAEIQSAREAMLEIGLMPLEDQEQPIRRSSNRASLAGHCRDSRQFAAARDFAYAIDGLNLSSREAASWALAFNQNHRCGAIVDFRTRFEVLYRVAYDIDGLNLSSSESRRFALEKAEWVSISRAEILGETVKVVREFLYGIDGLNLNSQEATQRSHQWVERSECESGRFVRDVVMPAFQQEYNFARAIDGLNLSSSDAREFASRQIWNLSRCADLLSP